jgi:hypothetical protein
MVSVSLRQNGGGTPERNPLAPGGDENVYPPAHFTPGKTPADWVETRTREAGWDQWPHPENPGLIADPDGYFDWAGRLLFLPDGSPNPDVSGAYRYQTRPDLCDPNAPDSEPVSPRYEPMWLRHKPGDTWMIGGKPFDPDDPGPYGNPRWRPDRRTGRHRRGEQPDPIPPWDRQPGDPPSPDFARTRVKWDAHGDWTPERIAASGRPEDGAGTIPERLNYRDSPAYIDPRSWQVEQDVTGEIPLRGRHGERSEEDDVEPHNEADADAHAGYIRPTWLRVVPDPPEASADPGASGGPETRTDRGGRAPGWRPNPEPEPDAQQGKGSEAEGDRARPSPRFPREARTRFWSEAQNAATTDLHADPSSDEGGYRFSRSREQAFDVFMAESAILHAAHLAPERPYFRERVAWVLHWALWILTGCLAARPEPLTAFTGATAHSQRPVRIPAQPAPVPVAPQANPQKRSERPAARPQRPAPVPVPATSYRPGAAASQFFAGAGRARALRAESSHSSVIAARIRAAPGQAERPANAVPYAAQWERAWDAMQSSAGLGCAA